MAAVTVRLPDGSTKEFASGTTAREFARSIGPRLAKAAVAATFDGRPVDLSSPLPDGAEVTVVTGATPLGREVVRHSTAHVLAQAVLRLWPGAHFAIGPVIEDGFYYDFELPGGAHFTDEDLGRIAAEMRAIMAEDQPFVRHEHSIEEGLELFGDQPFKREIIEAVGAGSDEVDAASAGPGAGGVSTYWNAPTFTDLCRGPHVPSTGALGHFALMRVAGAYWRGDEKRQQLQRIYGTAWESEEALAEHLHRLEEAEKRDHRRLGVELDLFSFPHELGGGLAVWHPKGGIVRKLMEDYSRQRHQDGGYEFVFTPHLANAQLFETSGHLGFYRDGMYPPMEMDNGTYYPKPMNCPMHCLIFASRQRSYRELPLRLFELGTVYRYERAGTLHGMMRIRGFTQDDSHIFCTEDQLGDEITSLLDFVMSVLRAFGFSEFTANLSTRDPEKYVGLYTLERMDEKKKVFSENFLRYNYKEATQVDFDQKNKANFTMFFKQRMEDLVRVCRQKCRNVKGKSSDEYQVFSGPGKPLKEPRKLLSDYEKLGYKKVDFSVFKSIRKKANVNSDATMFKFGDLWYIAIISDNRDLDLEDIVSSGYDPYENAHNLSPDKAYEIEEMKSFDILFYKKSKARKVMTLKKFISKNKKRKSYQEEIQTAKKLLRSLGE